MHTWGGYVATGVLGALVGASEIAFRYRDRPGAALLRVASIAYALINAAASAGALYVARVFGWDFGAHSTSSRDLLRVLLCGFGALALFRTKLFSAAVEGKTISFGPSHVLEQLLGLIDTQVDRWQAANRSQTVSEAMDGVDFDKAYASLPTYALGLLENADAEEQKRLGEDVAALLKATTMDSAMKSQQLGVAVIRVTGPVLLRRAVVALSPGILTADAAQRQGARRDTTRGSRLLRLARR
jgi:hypothetical protein